MEKPVYDINEAKKIAQRFGTAVLNEMHQNIVSLDLVERSVLLKSLKTSPRTSVGEVNRVEFSYEWYGFLQDRGFKNAFGKGIEINATNWRQDAIQSHKEQFDSEMNEMYAKLMIQQIVIDDIKLKL
jgi:hypothetical protein